MRPRLILAAVGVVFFFGISLLATFNRTDLSEQELTTRCAQSRPEWLSYQEDIKGQIGTDPVARWEGKPLSAALDGAQLNIAFMLSPPWSTYHQAAIPILLRMPNGEIYLPDQTEHQADRCIYRFTLKEAATPASLPWVEIHYPHTERRILLDSKGTWQAS